MAGPTRASTSSMVGSATARNLPEPEPGLLRRCRPRCGTASPQTSSSSSPCSSGASTSPRRSTPSRTASRRSRTRRSASGVGALLFTSVTFARERSLRIGRSHVAIALLAAGLGVWLNQISFGYATKLTTAATVALMLGTLPIFVALLSSGGRPRAPERAPLPRRGHLVRRRGARRGGILGRPSPGIWAGSCSGSRPRRPGPRTRSRSPRSCAATRRTGSARSSF